MGQNMIDGGKIISLVFIIMMVVAMISGSMMLIKDLMEAKAHVRNL